MARDLPFKQSDRGSMPWQPTKSRWPEGIRVRRYERRERRFDSYQRGQIPPQAPAIGWASVARVGRRLEVSGQGITAALML
jgi:hypothetical protein